MEKTLKYNAPAKAFGQALPMGNGTLGVMIYGGVQKERISLNHDTLWSGKPGQATVDTAYEAYQKAQKLLFEGKAYEAQRELEENFTGPWTNSYLPLGTLYFEREGSTGNARNYERGLDIENSLAYAKYEEDGVFFEREYFVSHPSDCIVIRLRSSKPVSYLLTGDCVGKSAVTAGKDALYFSGECPTSIAPSYAMKYKPIVYDGEGVKVSAIARVVCDGETDWETDCLKVKNAREVFLYFCAETSFVAFDKLPNKPTFYPCLAKMERIIAQGYEKIRAEHMQDTSELFNRMTVDFGQKSSDKCTDERLRNLENDGGMYELIYNFGRYLIIASSRKGSQATNLQGIWNESVYPPWSSNYTVNINTQMNYWPVLSCDLAECNYPLIDLIKNISENGRETARKFYRADGFVSHHNIDIWATTAPVGAKTEYSSLFAVWNMSSGWFCRHLFEHYEYTLDRKFLEETAYPIMRDCAKFYLSLLVKRNGKWMLSPSTSPENCYIKVGKQVTVAEYTTMTQSILQDLFSNTVKSAEILGVLDGIVEEIKEKLPDIGIYKIGSYGELLEYDREYEESDMHHRHVSHLYALYPADIITVESSGALAEACKRTLLRRGDDSTGWSTAWKMCLWAKLKEGDRVIKLLDDQLALVETTDGNEYYGKGGSFANLLCAPPFQIDGNFGLVAGMTLMFLQCEDGKLKILPALPKALPNGKIDGLLAKGSVKVDMAWQDGRLAYLALRSPFAQSVTVRYGERDIAVALKKDEKTVLINGVL